MSDFEPTARSRVRRKPDRARYDRETVFSILDEGLICHVGVVHEGQPIIIPMGYARDGERLLVHGSRGSRMLNAIVGGAELCVTVSLLDGIVVARTATHHSLNYRSVVIYGRGQEIEDEGEKLAAFRVFVEHFLPNHWDNAAPPSAGDLKAVRLVAVDIEEASAKQRSGPPMGDPADAPLVWTGELPLRTVALPGVAAPDSPADVPAPASIAQYARPGIKLHVD